MPNDYMSAYSLDDQHPLYVPEGLLVYPVIMMTTLFCRHCLSNCRHYSFDCCEMTSYGFPFFPTFLALLNPNIVSAASVSSSSAAASVSPSAQVLPNCGFLTCFLREPPGLLPQHHVLLAQLRLPHRMLVVSYLPLVPLGSPSTQQLLW